MPDGSPVAKVGGQVVSAKEKILGKNAGTASRNDPPGNFVPRDEYPDGRLKNAQNDVFTVVPLWKGDIVCD